MCLVAMHQKTTFNRWFYDFFDALKRFFYQQEVTAINMNAVAFLCSSRHISGANPTRGNLFQPHLKEYSSLQENPYNVRYIHTVLIIHI